MGEWIKHSVTEGMLLFWDFLKALLLFPCASLIFFR